MVAKKAPLDWYKIGGFAAVLLSAALMMWLIWIFCVWAANTVVYVYSEFAAPTAIMEDIYVADPQ